MARVAVAIASVFVLIASVRIVVADWTIPQGFDEPAQVAAGIEWLDRHTYCLDPIHPPLVRYAVALPLYLAGSRLPSFSGQDPRGSNYNDVGDAILYHAGQYRRNLFLARIGVLPFFALAVVALFTWTKREFGEVAACSAVALFSTTPSILAFSALAYNDLPAAALQFTCLCVLTLWLKKPSTRRTIILGIAAGLAFAAKFTSLPFLTAATVAVLMCRWWFEHRFGTANLPNRSGLVLRLTAAGVLSVVVLWGTYGFSVGHVQQAMQLSPATLPSFQHFPGPVRGIARTAVLSNPQIPAPELVHGLAEVWATNQSGPEAYLLGKVRQGGWWYFFPVALALKAPLPLLLLAGIGAVTAVRFALRKQEWAGLMPPLSILAILSIAMIGRYDLGTRYLLAVFPLLAALGGVGVRTLWRLSPPTWGRITLACLLSWQVIAFISAGSDFLAYFNELAPADPSRVLITGCDLDCGQDLFRLGNELRARGASRVALAVWSSADISQMGLPAVEVLKPYEPATGWIAISIRSRKLGHVLHESYPSDAFAWLDAFTPVAHVGRTILLYNVPERNSSASTPLNVHGHDLISAGDTRTLQ